MKLRDGPDNEEWMPEWAYAGDRNGPFAITISTVDNDLLRLTHNPTTLTHALRCARRLAALETTQHVFIDHIAENPRVVILTKVPKP